MKQPDENGLIERTVEECKLAHQSDTYFNMAEPYIEQQWDWCIWPAIKHADFSRVLELAPGYGRNTAKLLNHAREIHLVDVNQSCIDHCRRRFASYTGPCKLFYHVNDGKNLAALPANYFSFIYSWDSMVHFDRLVVRQYVLEFARVMAPGASGFVHHSNYGTVSSSSDWQSHPHWRSNMTADLFRDYASEANLRVVSQRLVDWENEKWRWKNRDAVPPSMTSHRAGANDTNNASAKAQNTDCISNFRKAPRGGLGIFSDLPPSNSLARLLVFALLASRAVPLTQAAELASTKPDAVVAADGSAQYQSVQDAITAAPQLAPGDHPWLISIKPGTYKEHIYIQREKRFISLVGESAANTILTYNLNANMKDADGKPIGTFATPSTYLDADDFTCKNLTFENSAGSVGQALAIRIDGDRDVFTACRFLGWQDTILADRGRHYFADCDITGAVDFIFGGATEYFDHCQIHCAGNGYITAASTPENQPFGFVFSHCRITGAAPQTRAFLGRPWRAFASVIFLNCEMSEVIRPQGWNNWKKPEREKTARYAEFASTGPGANLSARVPWAKQLTTAEAAEITPAKVLAGADDWNPAPPATRPEN
ncbi:MAG: pectinesterase family protein [Planctomycetota bacterium]|nr:pectinesterase family protein [Planctomycetota bacterium]